MIITLTLVDTDKTRFVDAMCERFNYTEKFRLPDGTKDPAAPTRAEYATKKLPKLIQDFIGDYEVQKAMETARSAAAVSVDAA